MSEAFYNENEPYAAQWLENLEREGHIAPGKVDARSIVDIKPKDLEGFQQAHFFAGLGGWSHALRLAGWPDDEEVWTGSCPCQPFSTAGRRKGFADERHLWPEWFRLIRKCRPRVVFGEQIAGTDGLRWLDLVFADMEGAGYACWATDTCAAGVGAPHLRQRLYFVAYASSERLRRPDVPQPHLEQDSMQSAQRGPGSGQTDGRARVRARDVVSGGSFELADSSEQRRDRIDSSVQPGGSHQADPEADGHSTARELGNARSQGGGGHAGAVPRTEAKSKREGRIARGVAHEPESASDALELGDASGARSPVGPGPEERFGAVRYEGPSPAETGATRGFWRDAEWWVCRDGKARPAKSEIFPLADGLSGNLERLRALEVASWQEVKKYAGTNKIDTDETLRMVRTAVRAKTGRKKQSARMREQFSSSEVLLDYLLCLEATCNGTTDSRSLSQARQEAQLRIVRSVRGDERDACAPRQRKSDGQRTAKSSDPMLALSLILARHAAAYRQAAGDAHAASDRVGRLRAIGNAIVPQQAALFIRAVMPLIGLKPAG